MKKTIMMLVMMMISLATFAQKNELKAADKAIKSSDYASAKTAIEQLEGMVGSMDDKTKANFYYLQFMTYGGLSKTNADYYDKTAQAYSDLVSIESNLKGSKYTDLAATELNTLVSDISAKGIADYQNGDYTKSKKELHEVFALSPKDTVFLEYAANAAYLDKDYDLALEYFTNLKDLGYTGITTEYSAMNTDTKEREVFASKAEMDLMKKSKNYTDFKISNTESKRPTIIKNIAFTYVEQGDAEKAIAAVQDARKMDPKDVGLILTEANLHIKLGQKEEFARLMEEAIALDPTNHVLYYNLGVISAEQGDMEKAKGYYKKAIELDPNYTDAYINLGSDMLDADKELVEQMNQNLSNFKKYDEIKAKQVDLYKEVIPIYEKANAIKPNDMDIVRTLMSLYENTEMDSKYKEMKAIYDSLR
ncbi:MAG: tetratricopeptide repeat protein [Lutimonas sp.]